MKMASALQIIGLLLLAAVLFAISWKLAVAFLGIVAVTLGYLLEQRSLSEKRGS